MNPTERIAKSASTPKAALFATLRDLPGVEGSAAPSLAARPRAVFAIAIAILAFTATTASAAVTHKYEPVPSEALSSGVPESCAPATPPCISGALTGASGIAPDGAGNIWVADSTPAGARVDRFDATTGALEGPQLIEEAGVTGLGSEGGTAVAVGHSFGGEQVYVQSQQGVAVYDVKTGKLAGTWTGAHTLGGPFNSATSRPAGVAVNSALGETEGDVYVARRNLPPNPKEPASGVVDVFSLSGVTKPGEEPAAPAAEITGLEYVLGVAVSPVNGRVFVESCSEPETRCAVDVFEPTAGVYSFLFAITEADKTQLGELEGVAVDGNGDVYVAQAGGFNGGGNQTPNVVDQFEDTGTEARYLGRLRGTPSGPFSAVRSVGVDPNTHHVFVAGGETVPLSAYGQELTIPAVEVSAASEIAATHVTLNGVVSLNKAGSAECKFDYGTTEAYGLQAVCEPSPVTETDGTAGEDVAVKATVSGLLPHTKYFFRVQATNNTGLPSTGEGAEDQGEVTTSGPGLEGEGASEVASDAAHLDATIDPNGLPTSYYFQYNTTGTGACAPQPAAAGCTTVPAAPEAIGSELREPGIQVSQGVQGLEANRTYHYRVIVVSVPTVGPPEVFPEPDQTFTTQPPGTGFALPDARQYELVSPVDKHGSSLFPIGVEGVIQSSFSGDAFTYIGSAPTEENTPGYNSLQQVFSTRGSDGWSSTDISPPHHTPTPTPTLNGKEYRFFSEDLSSGVVEPFGSEFTSLKPEVFPPDTERGPYLRHDQTCQATPSTCYEPVLTGAPGYADVPEGTQFGGGHAELGETAFVGASPDLSHVVVDYGGLSVWSAAAPPTERLKPVTVLPASEGGATVGGLLGREGDGGQTGNARWAVSLDGSRVVWTHEPSNAGLYLRINASQPQSALSAGRCTEPAQACTIRLDTVQGGSGKGEVLPEFQTGTRDDSRILFSDSQQLVKGAGPDDLYECEVVVEPTGPGCVVRDVAPGAGVGFRRSGEHTVGGVLGASEDGSYVYFVSNGAVADGAQAGTCTTGTGLDSLSCNLYMAHFDLATRAWEAPVFVASLSEADQKAWRYKLVGQIARVSPDGTWLTFMSSRSLTGYDNHDARSGKPDEEVFLYNGVTHRLACPSCNPTGARPDGVEDGQNRLIDFGPGLWPPTTWLAANIPNWTSFRGNGALHQSRYLSNSGRLFFNSSDALVPQDVNNQEDVYQWEPVGVGGCSSSAPGFESATGGCVALISSGASADESAFLDASENGNDVFFLTSEKLVPQDIDTAVDVYDAHLCSSSSPCPAPTVAPPECITADACRAAPSAPPGVFGAPSSATFSGPGNLAPPPPARPKPKTAAQIRAEKLTKALKACRKKRRGHKRALCEKQAKKKYGAVKASARKATRKGTR